jgi:hypothetical protein
MAISPVAGKMTPRMVFSRKLDFWKKLLSLWNRKLLKLELIARSAIFLLPDSISLFSI